MGPDRPPLVLVGKPGPGGEAIAAESGGRWLGPVGDEDLADLYRAAAVMAYPSHYEGFGLPVLEAMACGCPVVASDRGAIPEVAGDAAILVEPTPRGDRRRPAAGARARGRRAAARSGPGAGGALHPGGHGARRLGGRAGGDVRIAMAGTRGIPASYSGFETAVEQITERLTARGHQVTVYCRPHVVDRRASTSGRARGWCTCRRCATSTSTRFVHTLLSSAAHAAARARPTWRCSSSPATARCAWSPGWPASPTVINVDGLDSDRRKWNRVRQGLPARGRAPVAAAGHPRDHRLARGRRHLRARATAARSAWCPTAPSCPSTATAACWTARARAAQLRAVRRAAGAREQPPPAGGGLGADPLGQDARHEAGGGGRRALRLGLHHPRPPRRRPARAASRATCSAPATGSCSATPTCSARPTEVGGTHPVILEALAAGNCVLVNDYRPNAETVGDAAATFPLAGGAAALAAPSARWSPTSRRRRLGAPGRGAGARALLVGRLRRRLPAALRARSWSAPPRRRRGSRRRSRRSRGAAASRSETSMSTSGQRMPTSGSSQAKPRSSSGVVVGRALVDHVGDFAHHDEAVGEADREVDRAEATSSRRTASQRP